jgi:cytochrome d ubiquinol oxidase subunit II
MDLNILWFVLLAVLYAGFFFLEGFDFGVGMLVPFVGKTDVERRAVINTIGPHWDGNEVWLIVAGGATFAAFPGWYATMFSGFYLEMFLLLVALIFRGMSFEFRSKIGDPKWRNTWDWVIAVCSFLAPFLLGVVFTNLVKGVPIDGTQIYTGTFWTLLNPMAILGGLAVAGLFLLHGANFLALKLTDALRDRAVKIGERVWVAVLVLVGGWFSYLMAGTTTFGNKGFGVVVAPFAAVFALIATRWLARMKREGWAFILTGLAIVLTVASLFIALFPNVMISSTTSVNNLTIYNASSSDYTLKVMSIVAAILLPIVLLYQAWTYWVFRKRITADPEELVY